MSDPSIFAYIPARGGSVRVPGKNAKELDGIPVIQRVINNVRSAGITSIAVSTDDPAIAELARSSGAETLDLRRPELANSEAGFLELVQDDLPRFSDHFETPHVMFTLATAGLVTPSVFIKAREEYIKKQPALLMAVTRYPISPFWALVQDQDNGWRPYFPELSRLPSTQHPEVVVDAGLFFFLDVRRCRDLDSLLNANPMEVFEVPEEMAVDVDTPGDWEVLEQRFRAQAGSKSEI